jgi:alanine or glycine:cation symporter, AGCS family
MPRWLFSSVIACCVLAIDLPIGIGCRTSFGQEAVAQEPPGTTDTAASDTAASASNPTSSNPTSSASADATATASAPSVPAAAASSDSKLPPWMQEVDGWFKRVLVDPISKVVFFDFGIGVPFVVIWLLSAGVFLTVRMGMINLRGFWHAIRLTKGDYDDPNETGDVSHFQALSAALSGTVGLGNIGGVAVAIGTGGPGATVWIMLAGLLGMTSKFAECTLAQIYRTKDNDGRILGGPMRYLRLGLGDIGLGTVGSVLAVLFAVLCIGASFGGGNSYQVAQSLTAIKADIPLLDADRGGMPWIYGLVMAGLVGAVIIGGIKSIGRFAELVVPVMCLSYIAICTALIAMNAAEVPAALGKIFSGAMSPNAIYGGFLGVMVIGIRRAVFSNEAGVGSAAIAHSAAKTDEPVSEGIVALLEPFIDTVVVCTFTAIVIVVTGVYSADNFAPDSPVRAEVERVVQVVDDPNTPEADPRSKCQNGAELTLIAFRSGGQYWFGYVLFLTVFLFALSTCISWSYYGERCAVQLFGQWASLPYKLVFITFTFLGAVVAPANVLEFSDLMILSMSVPNLIGVFLLSGRIRQALDDYWGRYQRGEIKTTRKN